MNKALFLLITLSTLYAQDPYAALLFHGNCTTCHHEQKTLSAPAVVTFKKRYMDAFKTKEDFILYMSQWVVSPKKETSIMHDAIKKHGLMPELGFDLSTIEIISRYIYDTDFTQRHPNH